MTVFENPDVVLIGSGIMSANLAAMLKNLDPKLRMQVFEVTPELAQESSNGWHNAGTGHAGICEISYTPRIKPGQSLDITRAISIFEQFEYSKHFWSYAVESGMIASAAEFIRPVPHLSFVQGEDDSNFLGVRYQALKQHHFFRDMEFTQSDSVISQWAPIIMEGREPNRVAATKMDRGTEVDYGALARALWSWFARQPDCDIAASTRVTRLQQDGNHWKVSVVNLLTGERRTIRAKYVFVGAGGGTVRLLQTTGLNEAMGLGGFPIGGQWLVCDRPDLANRHTSKVYGMTPPSAPSLGGPHLDVRWIQGKRQLMFGPFASWTTRFLKYSGRWTDLPGSVRPGNLMMFLQVAAKNRNLVTYLIAQGLQSMNDRMRALKDFYPLASNSDWKLVQAGIRVQTLRKENRGTIFFGTEIFTAAGNSISALLGASPGASVSVNIAFGIIQKCFPHLLHNSESKMRMKQMIPVFDVDIKKAEHESEFVHACKHAEEVLRLDIPAGHE